MHGINKCQCCLHLQQTADLFSHSKPNLPVFRLKLCTFCFLFCFIAQLTLLSLEALVAGHVSCILERTEMQNSLDLEVVAVR